MIKKSSLFALALSMLFGIVCFTSCNTTSKKKSNDVQTFTSGDIKIAVDESFKPIIDQEIKVFEALNPEANITPIYCNEVDALNLLFKGKVELVIVTRKLSDKELQSFKNKQLPVYQNMLATDGIGLIVNKANRDTMISVDQVRDILIGKIKKWSQLDEHSKLGDIQMVFDNPNSSTVRFARDSICNGQPFDQSRIFAQKNNIQVFQYVMQAKNAIGVIGVNWLDDENDTTNLHFKKGVNVMSVMGVSAKYLKPYQAYLALQTYPFTRGVFTICTDPRDSGLAQGFSGFLTGDKGQRIFLKSALVPATQPVNLVQVNDSY